MGLYLAEVIPPKTIRCVYCRNLSRKLVAHWALQCDDNGRHIEVPVRQSTKCIDGTVSSTSTINVVGAELQTDYVTMYSASLTPSLTHSLRLSFTLVRSLPEFGSKCAQCTRPSEFRNLQHFCAHPWSPQLRLVGDATSRVLKRTHQIAYAVPYQRRHINRTHTFISENASFSARFECSHS